MLVLLPYLVIYSILYLSSKKVDVYIPNSRDVLIVIDSTTLQHTYHLNTHHHRLGCVTAPNHGVIIACKGHQGNMMTNVNEKGGGGFAMNEREEGE